MSIEKYVLINRIAIEVILMRIYVVLHIMYIL